MTLLSISLFNIIMMLCIFTSWFTSYLVFSTVIAEMTLSTPLRRRFAWHVDSSPHPRSIRHLTWTFSKRSRARYFSWHELSSRSRRLQRFRNHGKRWRFDSANALGGILRVLTARSFSCHHLSPPGLISARWLPHILWEA